MAIYVGMFVYVYALCIVFSFFYHVYIQWRPGIGPPHKADHPGIRTTFFQSQIFPHLHNVLSDSESGPTRDSGHGPPFFSPKSEKDSKNGPAKKK